MVCLKLEGAMPGNDVCADIRHGSFNGMYGTPTFPKILDEDERLTTAEQDVIVSQAKLILAQHWSTRPVKHRLVIRQLRQRGPSAPA